MATIQYIGARYVPKFYEGSSGTDWEQGVSYEPLTIVTYSGNSYTSKKVVPSTIDSPNLNPEYWANTGNYNAQIGQFQADLNEVSGEVSQLAYSVGEINGDLDFISVDTESKDASTTSPIYHGDLYIYGYFLSCCVKHDNKLYAFCPPISSPSLHQNYGKAFVYNFANGSRENVVDMELGHAQSCCYNDSDGFIYLVPMINYGELGSSRDQRLYKINPATMSIVDRISTGMNIRNITYDSAKGKMYIMDDYMNIYNVDFSGDGLTLACTITNAFESPEIIQDFAIHNDIIYMTSTLNRCIKCIWRGESTLTPNNVFVFSSYDSLNRWKLGECEGIEFDNAGHLFVSSFVSVTPSEVFEWSMHGTVGFICELAFNGLAPYPLHGVRTTPANRTFAINQGVTQLWIPDNVTLRDVNQIYALVQTYHSVYLTADYVTGNEGKSNLSIQRSLWLNTNGHKIKCNRIELMDDFYLYNLPAAGSAVLEFTKDNSTNGMIYITRGNLHIGNSSNFTVVCRGETSRAYNFINTGSLGSRCWFGANVTSDLTLYLANDELVRYSLYYGATKIYSPS